MGFTKTKIYIIVAALSFLLVMATAATVRVGGRGGAEKVVSLGGVGFSKTHKVGGESGGWTNPKANIGDVDYYKKWASSRNFSVGDTIVFEYNRQSDNVIVSRNRQDFESCRTKSLNRGASTTGSDSILLTFTGSHYFWSGFPGHCQAGQKFEILVREGYRPPRPRLPKLYVDSTFAFSFPFIRHDSCRNYSDPNPPLLIRSS
ncbi:blue copper protein 1b-like [Citrus sinensis]|nr:blue copper protein 1b-like [Citrus sinensis]